MNYITIITAIALVLAGTISGYITNKYAVRWLFKPVTLFGKQILDVSILSTEEKQETFIESLSDCVERRILTNDILKKEIINETMKAHLDEIIDHFISESLPAGFKEAKLSEMKGFDESKSTLRDFVDGLLDKNADALMVYVLDAIKISDYLTETQIQETTDNFYDNIKIALKNNSSIRDRITGILTELFFAAMFNSDGRSAIGKLTSKLFGGNSGTGANPLSGLSGMTLPDKISASVKSLLSSAVSKAVSDKSAGSYVADDNRKSLSIKLSQEILKKYDQKIQELSDKSVYTLSDALSKNEKVKQTISNIIYDYLDQNLNQFINGKVKDTVKIALGRLDPDQLCEVAERLLRGELKYLSYFGAVIGCLVSIPALLLTLGSFTASGFAATPSTFIFGLILMGFIGVITNVIAIMMFFHPYKKIDFLAKHKHTSAFSQGLVLQNQKVFAHTLGEYIGSELLTPENIIKMLETHKDSFIDKLSEKMIPLISGYFRNEANSRKSSARLSAFLFNKLSENRENMGILISGELGSKTLRSLLDLNNPETEKKLFEFYLSFLNKDRPRPENDGSEDSDNKFIIYAITNLIKNSQTLTHGLWVLLAELYNSEFADKHINELLSIPELSVSAKKSLSKLCQNDEAFDEFRRAADMCISSIAAGSDQYISPELMDSISHKISESVYDASIACVPSLMEDIHIASVTEEKVCALEPEEIKNVVLSFAQPAFRKLYALGLIGCVFGINSYLAFILFVIDETTDRKKLKADRELKQSRLNKGIQGESLDHSMNSDETQQDF